MNLTPHAPQVMGGSVRAALRTSAPQLTPARRMCVTTPRKTTKKNSNLTRSFRTVVRKWVKPEDLNQHGSLFGGRLLEWIDEDAAIIAMSQLGTKQIVTRYISEIAFVARAQQGDLLSLEFCINKFGRTSLTLSCEVENTITGEIVLKLESIVFVSVDNDGRPAPHGQTEATYGTERLRGL